MKSATTMWEACASRWHKSGGRLLWVGVATAAGRLWLRVWGCLGFRGFRVGLQGQVLAGCNVCGDFTAARELCSYTRAADKQDSRMLLRLADVEPPLYCVYALPP